MADKVHKENKIQKERDAQGGGGRTSMDWLRLLSIGYFYSHSLKPSLIPTFLQATSLVTD